MGCSHGSPNCRQCVRPRRPRVRICLRKGCGQKYLPRRWNQHYCQDPHCLREVRRWQAAKRQAKRRQDETVKTQHAEAQRSAPSACRLFAATIKASRSCAGAWSRSKNFLPTPYATGQDAMNRSPKRMAGRRVSAAPPVARRFAGSTIANASGCCEALSKVGTPASGSTPPPAHGALRRRTTAPAPCHRPRRNHDPIPPVRRSAVCCLGPHAL